MNLLLAAVLLMQDKTPEQWIEQLRSGKVEDREEASRILKTMGPPALPALRHGANDRDNEVARRCAELVKSISSERAQREFQKFEDAVQRARTIRMKYSLESAFVPPDGKESKVESSATLLVKEGNKAHFSGKFTWGGRTWDYIRVSDGSRFAKLDLPVLGEAEWTSRETAPHFNSALRTLLLRLYPQEALERLYQEPPSRPEVDAESYLVSEFQEAPELDGTRGLSFRLSGTGRLVDEIVVSLWIDVDASRLRRRQVMMKSTEGKNKGDFTLTENYDEFTLNADIPDEKFKLPEEKK